MLRQEPIKDTWAEQRLFNNRVIWALAGMLLLSGLLTNRLIHLQVVEYQRYADLSHGNRVRIQPLAPTRGIIFDRNGVVMAENLPVYQMALIAEQVSDIERTLDRLMELDLIDDEQRERFFRARRGKRSFEAVPLRYRLNDEELARFSVHRHEFPGVDIQAALVRSYPLGSSAVHVLGYVGAISEFDLKRIATSRYAATSHIGKTGIERQYEDQLHGEPGNRQLLVNAQGREMDPKGGASEELFRNRKEPVPGSDLILSLDSRLQIAAEKALGDRRGTVVAIDVNNGDILALVSQPGFDPNLFSAGGMSNEEYFALQNNADKPMFDRVLSGTYPPGSIVKPFLALAGLEYHAVTPGQSVLCEGYYSIPGNEHRYRDWKKEGHGITDLHDAIAESCDVYFYMLAMELGIDRIHAMLADFGFGKITGVDLPGEKKGLMPSREWKKGAFSRRSEQIWFPGETVITGIGQGYMLATPLQLTHFTATMATRGKRFKPRLVTAFRDPLSGEITEIPPQELAPVELANDRHWDEIHKAMAAVMNTPRGTGWAAALGGEYKMAGKTGSAQVFSIGQEEEYEEEEIDERLRDHALFIAFTPLENPQIAISVLVENGGSGGRAAGPVVRQVLDAWYREQKQ
ncbi:MAG: penicillin-binding protein 2 [Gammaproteobacteria bacterium]|nr:penicillin-binding protein 2 [Gammaproteobacteria bacterium]